MPPRRRRQLSSTVGQGRQPSDNALKDSLLSKIIDALHRPPYVLIFGLCVLFVLFGGVSTSYGLKQDRTLPLVLGFSSLLVALISGIIVIRFVEAPGTSRAPAHTNEATA